MNYIPFNKPLVTNNELKYLDQVLQSGKFCGDGPFTKSCNQRLAEFTKTKKALLTTSCTHALEMSAFLCNIQPGDEVIMSSYTFVSTANAFVLRGAKIIFVDVHKNTMNMNENLIEAAISSKTKAIVLMHYAGVACEMDSILAIAKRYGLYIIEDAAQCIDAYYNNQHLGTFGDIGSISFHETKNIHCGEGGTLLINKDKFVERAEIIREKGTDRSKFIRGIIDKYSWVDMGSSYLPSEFNAALLLSQLDILDKVTQKRITLWELYYKELKELSEADIIQIPFIPQGCRHNAHLFYIKCRDIEERTLLINHLMSKGIQAVFHYIPLHNSVAGKKFSSFFGIDQYTTIESERLLRLPLYYDLNEKDVFRVCQEVINFYQSSVIR